MVTERKSWCDGCMSMRPAVRLVDCWCLGCGAIETSCLCPECRPPMNREALQPECECDGRALRKYALSLFPEAELSKEA